MRILITAGPTREYLDPVRFLSNASSGLQGVLLAEEGLARGWRVELVHGPLEVAVPTGVDTHPVTSAENMLARCLELHSACDVVIGAAAVSDFRPSTPLTAKHKRTGATWTLELVPTRDILRALAKEKGKRVHIGFALETENLLENGVRKLREKNLDWLVANRPSAIGSTSSSYLLLGSAGAREELGEMSKRELARRLLDAAAETAAQRR